ncbi:MAG: hypothetical protein AMXMBFR83_18100 [Phycisphaerae bacterium]
MYKAANARVKPGLSAPSVRKPLPQRSLVQDHDLDRPPRPCYRLPLTAAPVAAGGHERAAQSRDREGAVGKNPWVPLPHDCRLDATSRWGSSRMRPPSLVWDQQWITVAASTYL